MIAIPTDYGSLDVRTINRIIRAFSWAQNNLHLAIEFADRAEINAPEILSETLAQMQDVFFHEVLGNPRSTEKIIYPFFDFGLEKYDKHNELVKKEQMAQEEGAKQRLAVAQLAVTSMAVKT